MASLLGVLIIVSLVLGTQSCDIDEYERCTKVFTDKYPAASDSFRPSYSEEQLTAVCADFDITADCVEPAIRRCNPQGKSVWEILDNVMTYYCTDETKLVLRNHSDCLEDSALQTEIGMCNSDLQATTSKIGATLRELCNAAKKFARCTVDSADELCGPVAAKWYAGLVNTALDPIKGQLNCYFTVAPVSKAAPHPTAAPDSTASPHSTAGSSTLTSCSTILLAMLSLYFMMFGQWS